MKKKREEREGRIKKISQRGKERQTRRECAKRGQRREKKENEPQK